MKVYLDDFRPTPSGWISARWPGDVIALLKTGKVTHVSLDHDLGDDSIGTGYDVLLWIENAVVNEDFEAPEITVHTANPSAEEKMERAKRQIIELDLRRRRGDFRR